MRDERMTGVDEVKVLVVDDNPANLAAFEAILATPGVVPVLCRSGAEAMRALLTGEFAAILLDINMPGLDGLQTAELIRSRERCRNVPILFITAYHSDAQQILRGYATGAVDYLVKPVLPEVLKSKVRVFVELYRKTQQVQWQATQLRAVNLRLRREAGERREAERAAQFEREERQRVTLSCVADGVIATDAQGRVSFVNPTAEALTGWRADEALGLEVPAVVDAPDGGPGEMVSAVLGGQGMQVVRDGVLRSREGRTLYVDYSVAPVHDRTGGATGCVLILRDNTSRREAEIERERVLALEHEARRQAEEANRVKDEFLAVISHELRTPLHAIMGWTQVLRQSRPSPPQTRALDAIQRSAGAQRKLIEDLLEMSRMVNGDIDCARDPVDVPALVAAAAETLLPQIQDKGLRLDLRLDMPPVAVLGDAPRLQQAVSNVLANAVKFTPAGGTVRVYLGLDGEMLQIRVEDTGEGLDPSFLPHLFQRFRQADSSIRRRHGGLGLGLAIARHIMALHGGGIDAHSAGPGTGSTFTLYLPWSVESGVEPAHEPAHDEPSAPMALLQGTRVLVVDDEPDTLQMLATVIRGFGAEVREAGCARDAVDILKAWRPAVLVSDICMPDEDGYALMRRVRELGADGGGRVRALALTAMARDEDVADAFTAGFDRHLTKPVMPEVLGQIIAGLLEARDGSHV